MNLSKILSKVNTKDVVESIDKDLSRCFLQECAEYSLDEEVNFCLNTSFIFFECIDEGDETNNIDFFLESSGISYSVLTSSGYKHEVIPYNSSEKDFSESLLSGYMEYSDLEIARQVRVRYRKFLVL